MTVFYKSKGILHQRSCVECPQQNGIVEHKHQHILNIARSLFFQSNILKTFWHFSVAHVVHLIYHIPSPFISHKTHYFLSYDKDPVYDSLESFECLAYASTITNNCDKFNPRSKNCVFLGYRKGTKGY